MDKHLRERFGGIDRLYGSGALARFAACHLTVVGIGGVGSWAVEALARSGIGKLTLVDADDLCVSNTNRQLPALEGQYGRAKVEAIAYCRRRKQPIVTVGSAGGRSDVTQVRVRDLSRTEHDAMLSLIRRKLRGEFNFPKNHDRYFGVPAVYSLENVRYPQADGSVCGIRPQLGKDEALKLDCGAGLGAATHVTGAFAFAAVGKVLEMLLKKR